MAAEERLGTGGTYAASTALILGNIRSVRNAPLKLLTKNLGDDVADHAQRGAARERILGNIAESQQARASSGFAQTPRRWTATDYYEAAGWPSRRISSHLNGINFSRPVTVSSLPAGSRVVQYQVPGAPVGNYFAPVGTPGSQLGMYTGGRIPQVYETTSKVKLLQSTADKVIDDWSVPFWKVHTNGGGTQFFTPNPSLFRLVE